MPQIEIHELNVSKGDKLICDVSSMSVEIGEHVAVVGSNGVGKTTLMRVLAGFERDFQGRCDIAVPPRECVLVHQMPYLFRGTVFHNIAYGLRSRGIHIKERRRIADEWLDRFAIPDMAEARCANLSGGERKRVALARALAVCPQLLLLDEPFAEVDDAGIRLIAEVLSELQSTTVVLTSAIALSDALAASVCEMKMGADTLSVK